MSKEENSCKNLQISRLIFKRSITRIAMALFLLFFAVSCTICEKPCMNYVPNAFFDFVKVQSSQSLIFGPGKIYDPTSFRVYSMSGSDTIYHRSLAGRSSWDSVFVVTFDQRRFDTAYIRLNQNDIDTIKVHYQLQQGSACPDTYIVESIRYNGIDIHINKEMEYVIEK